MRASWWRRRCTCSACPTNYWRTSASCRGRTRSSRARCWRCRMRRRAPGNRRREVSPVMLSLVPRLCLGTHYPRGSVSLNVRKTGFTLGRQSLQESAFPGRAWARERQNSQTTPRVDPMRFFLFILANAFLFIRPSEFIAGLSEIEVYRYIIIACLAVSLPAVFQEMSLRFIGVPPIVSCVVLLLPAVFLSGLFHGNFE